MPKWPLNSPLTRRKKKLDTRLDNILPLVGTESSPSLILEVKTHRTKQIVTNLTIPIPPLRKKEKAQKTTHIAKYNLAIASQPTVIDNCLENPTSVDLNYTNLDVLTTVSSQDLDWDSTHDTLDLSHIIGADDPSTPNHPQTVDMERFYQPTIEGLRSVRDFTKGRIELPTFSGDLTNTQGLPNISSIQICEKIEIAFPEGNDLDKIYQIRRILSGSALKFAQRREIEQITVWEEFKTSLHTEFPINTYILQTQLHQYNPRRETRESLVEFGKRVCGELDRFSDTGTLITLVKEPKIRNIIKEIIPWNLRHIITDYKTPWLDALREIERQIEFQPSSKLTREAISAETGIFAPVSVFTEKGNNLTAEGQSIINNLDPTFFVERVSNTVLRGIENSQNIQVAVCGNNCRDIIEAHYGYNTYGYHNSQRPPCFSCKNFGKLEHIPNYVSRQKTSRNLQLPIKTYPPRNPIICWLCKKPGHRKSQCFHNIDYYRYSKHNNRINRTPSDRSRRFHNGNYYNQQAQQQSVNTQDRTHPTNKDIRYGNQIRQPVSSPNTNTNTFIPLKCEASSEATTKLPPLYDMKSTTNPNYKPCILVKLERKEGDIIAMLDSGSTENLIDVNAIGSGTHQAQRNIPLTGIGGVQIYNNGRSDVHFKLGNYMAKQNFIVIKNWQIRNGAACILGTPGIYALELDMIHENGKLEVYQKGKKLETFHPSKIRPSAYASADSLASDIAQDCSNRISNIKKNENCNDNNTNNNRTNDTKDQYTNVNIDIKENYNGNTVNSYSGIRAIIHGNDNNNSDNGVTNAINKNNDNNYNNDRNTNVKSGFDLRDKILATLKTIQISTKIITTMEHAQRMRVNKRKCKVSKIDSFSLGDYQSERQHKGSTVGDEEYKTMLDDTNIPLDFRLRNKDDSGKLTGTKLDKNTIQTQELVYKK